ncbi:MAG TPA: hypothetical protein VHP57_11085, partial [Acidimicrobiia bacterium]|nr:hypothetical protein [Acidimicrobiia bacterium]
ITTILLSAQLAALTSSASAAGTVRPRTHYGSNAAFVETKNPSRRRSKEERQGQPRGEQRIEQGVLQGRGATRQRQQGLHRLAQRARSR